MAPYEEIHERLLDRALELACRLEHLEGELEHREQLDAVPGAPQAASPVLAGLIESARRELEQLRRSLRRIAAHAYGRCVDCRGAIPSERLRVEPHSVRCMDCAPVPEPDPLERLRAQHSGLRALLASIRELVSGLCADERSRSETGGLLGATLALMADLERELGRHFRLEEQGGYLMDALEVAPRHARRAAQLERQHERFRKEATELLERARLASRSSREWQAIQQDFQDFADALLEHEQAENEIIADAFLGDQGGG